MNYTQIEDDIFNTKCEVICHQTNCVLYGPDMGGGLYYHIVKHFPYADVYKHRTQPEPEKFGEINIDKQDGFPDIIGLNGQIDLGKGTNPPEDRETYFQIGLDKVYDYMISNNKKTIAFPYKIGCGLACGNWDNYSAMLDKFALKAKDKFEVFVYKNEK